MMMMRRGLRTLSGLMALTAFMVAPQVAEGQSRSALPLDLTEYLDSAVAVMRGHALGADTVDWEAFRGEIHRRAEGATETVDTYGVLRWALRALNPHSFLQVSGELRERELARRAGSTEAQTAPRAPRVVRSPFSDRANPGGRLITRGDLRVGIVAVPGFGGHHTVAFADSIQDVIRRQRAAGACGWIVDLRGNGGGNMWPMLAGLSPLLGDGVVGEFHGREGITGRWVLDGGVSGIEPVDGGEMEEVGRVSEAMPPLDPPPPVAVLFDGGTASSGEAVAIAFTGGSGTRSFGLDSYGFTTANDGFRLPDGANMVLTVGVNADRRSHPYPDGLEPDQRVPYREDGTVPASLPEGEDPQVEAAISWLSDRCAGNDQASSGWAPSGSAP